MGSQAYDQRLSESRAEAVVEFLAGRGITREWLKFIGYGFKKPIASNDTEEGTAESRRTEFLVLDMNKKEIEFAHQPTTDVLTEFDPEMPKPEENGTPSNLPDKYKIAGFDGNGMIASSEVIGVIDGFFDGSIDLSTEDIFGRCDYFFEQ